MAEPIILIVEDEDETLHFLKNTLSRALKCNVDIARNAEEGLSNLSKNDYALIVLDIKMPGKSGIDFMREAKTKGKLPKILVVSGYDDESVLQEALEEGALDYIPKPVVTDLLINKVRALINKPTT
jgi:DNA-binding response OmpR family regulator